MMGDGADRLAVIGMGWIGAYMVPCYRSLLGEGYEKRMFAVKAGSRGIEELRHRYGFEIIAGNCLDKLKEYKPGILVLSVRPHEVAGVAEDTIKPYVKYRREQGLGGLLLFNGKRYHEHLCYQGKQDNTQTDILNAEYTCKLKQPIHYPSKDISDRPQHTACFCQ